MGFLVISCASHLHAYTVLPFSSGGELYSISPCQFSSRILSCKIKFLRPFVIARHSRLHMHFQLSRMFQGFIAFFILRIHVQKTSQSSRIVELWLFFCPLMFFFLLIFLWHTWPKFWSYVLGPGRCFVTSPGPRVSLTWCILQKKTNCVKPIHCAESILPASTFPKSSIRHSCYTSNVVCVRLTTSMICERAFLWHTQFFFLEHDQDKWGFLTYARNHVLLPIRLVLVVALQNLVLLFLLEDQSGVLLLFDILVGCSEFWTFSCQLCGTVNKWEYEFVSFVRHRNFFLLSFNSKTHRLRRSPVIPQRQLRVRLRSSFLPHGERISTPKKMRRLSCRTDGASPDLPLISGGIRLLLRKKYAWPIHMTFCPLMVHLGHCASSNDVP